MADDRQTPRHNQLYGRRRGRPLRARGVHLIENLLPKLRVDLAGSSAIVPQKLFSSSIDEFWLEIGFGGGEHLARQACTHPEIGMIGCEPFVNGVAKLLSAVNSNQLNNVRIHDGDARDLLPRIANGSIARVFVLFPDPWPKRRHNKRRFINQRNLTEIWRILKPGGEFRIASDIANYISWTLFEMHRHGGFDWLAETPADWRERPADWPATRYEAKAICQKRTPCYLKFRRLPLRSN